MTDTNSDSIPLKPRVLVLCFDGTANQYDGDNTNVVRLFSLLKKDDFHEQLCYYQAGIGTYFQPGVVSPLFQWVAKIADEAVAWYLDAHVMDGYRFLMQNYNAGDKICLFGFSRGAYTARALAGMLHKVGLLPKDNDQQIPFAYKLYRKTSPADVELGAGFKQTFCRTVQVDFVGVWDTVSSVGVVMGRSLPFTTANETIKTFRHALSLDEHRTKFQPNLYHRPSPNEQAARLDPEYDSPVSSTTSMATHIEKATKPKGLGGFFSRLSKKRRASQNGIKKKDIQDQDIEAQRSTPQNKEGPLSQVSSPSAGEASVFGDTMPGGTDILEVWFAGVHGDVGGGSVADGTPHSLADITLRWMIREIQASQCGVLFDASALKRLNIPEFGVRVPMEPSTSSEPQQLQLGVTDKNEVKLNNPASTVASDDKDGELNKVDALEPMHDELGLKGNWAWWLLEIIPTNYTWQDAKGVWHKTWCFHLGRGRQICAPHPNFHITVQERMQDKALKYSPKAVWKKGTETYVE
ncbi:hypothetical protein JAAARDRAFT_171302 [Jaapia argillacea MUCL 33604]|uniref:T6SS Phospholipase effector Tle1-like catalytic domain-containing protein n=1 Tax=Jaapia argillacea MUCL 33604 TaxID=933084 RepID=A0A067Q6W4_9AGAM|nr:hypothetical protein JAAARDRAFT_171302 [Jaapia argillacea MUCL 33604]